MDSPRTNSQSTTEGIDFSKLKIIIRHNWIWIVLILVIINLFAYRKIRYTKELYESESEIKLDLKTNAMALGMKNIVEDPQSNLISGEIELIQSKLFLSRVVDSIDLNVSFYSIGRVLENDLYGNPPALIRYKLKDNSLYNVPIYFSLIDNNRYGIQIGKNGKEIIGNYGQKVSVSGADILLERNENFHTGDEVGYYFTFNSKDVLLNNFSRHLTVEPLNLSANTIRLSFIDNNRDKAQQILNTIDTVYLFYSNDQKNLANKQKIDWLTNELHQVEKKMEDYEHYFENFTLQNKTNDLNDDLRNTISSIYKVDTQRYDLSKRITELNQINDDLTTGNFYLTLPQQYNLPEFINKNLEQIQQLYADQERLKLSYNEVTFAYRSKQKEIENIRAKVFNQLTSLKIENLKRLQELNQKKAKLEKEFATMPDKSTQFSKNQRFYKLYEELYLSMMKSKSEFEITQAGNIPDFKILSSASLPGAPLSPNKTLIAGIGFVASLILILFFIGILYLINNKITNINELDKLMEVPVLGLVPLSRYLTNDALYVVDHPKSMVSEAIRTLRTNLDFFSASTKKKVIAISSTVSGEGKSFIAMNLGGVIAMSSKKVILLDLDMRKPKIKLPILVEDLGKGISTVLIRKHTWQEAVVKTSLPNLDYIPSGPHPPNPSELLLNGEFTGMLEELKQHYDFIILDTPPVGLVTDGIMAMKRADISIYVFRSNYSKKEFILNLKRIISINKFTNITTLLNGFPMANKKSYGYGYYEESTRLKRIKSYLKKS